jgi:hypothetical protein
MRYGKAIDLARARYWQDMLAQATEHAGNKRPNVLWMARQSGVDGVHVRRMLKLYTDWAPRKIHPKTKATQFKTAPRQQEFYI